MRTGTQAVLSWARRNAVALLALFVALGGTGYAAAKIDGRQIKKASVAGAALKKNTLGGREIKESGLAKVPNAARADVAATAEAATTASRATSAASADAAPPAGAAGGALAGTYPNPSVAAAAPPTAVAANPSTATDPCLLAIPQTGVFCGTSAARWRESGYAAPTIEYWRDRLGGVHVRGEAEHTTGALNGFPIFHLPEGMRPKVIHAFPVATGAGSGAFEAGSAIIVVYPEGGVALFNSSVATPQRVFIGEVQFRTDA